VYFNRQCGKIWPDRPQKKYDLRTA